MRSTLLSIVCVMALTACSSTPPVPRLVETPQLHLPPPPADVMVPREPNFLERIRSFFSDSAPTPTP